MLLDICLGNKSTWRILSIYGESPGAGFTRQDLKKHTQLGNKALSMALNRLCSFGILRKKDENFSYTIYKLNRGNKYSEDILKLLLKERHDLEQLPYDFKLIASEFSRKVIDSIDTNGIYLFGSIAKGTYREESDIDFAILVKDKKPDKDMALVKITDELSKKFKRNVQSFILTNKQIRKNKSDLVKEILKHGIRIV
ncbi:MAG: hypothetical protein MAG795_00510 [Candidatus Woesearchaeota archaeon]|nr:hypothetical protein [Candidatus Woesearchaeota archaeon]